MWGAIIAGVGSLFAASSSSKAARGVEQATSINADLVMEETNEEIRRLETQVGKSEGTAKAASAASGVQMSGSRKKAIDEIQAENIKQLQWLRKSGIKKSLVIKKGGQLQGSQLKSQSTASAIGGVAQITQGLFSNYSKSGT